MTFHRHAPLAISEILPMAIQVSSTHYQYVSTVSDMPVFCCYLPYTKLETYTQIAIAFMLQVLIWH